MYKLHVYGKVDDKKRFTVRDHLGQILYLIVKHKNTVKLSQLHGNLTLEAKQIKFSPFPIFQLLENEKKIGSIRKHPALFGIRESYFRIQPFDWIATGDFAKGIFTVKNNHQIIIESEKESTEKYIIFKLQIKEKQDIPLASLLAVILDHYEHTKDTQEEDSRFKTSEYNLGIFSYQETEQILDNHLKFKMKRNKKSLEK